MSRAKQHPEISLIIPTWNERECLPQVLGACRQALSGRMYEVIIVDDDSPDGTGDWTEEVSRRSPTVRLIRRRGCRGLATAVVAGFRAAVGEKLIVMDGDGQHNPKALPLLLEALERTDLAVASRYCLGGSVGSWGLARRLASRAATRLTRARLRIPLQDPLSGFFALRRDTLMSVLPNLKPSGYKILLEVYCRLRARNAWARCAEVPVRFYPRIAGRNKVSFKVFLDFGRQLNRLRCETMRPASTSAQLGLARSLHSKTLQTVTREAAAGIMERTWEAGEA